MNLFRRISCLLCSSSVALLLVPAAGAQTKPDADIIEMQHYVLTVDKVTRLGDVLQDMAQLAQKNPQLASTMESDSDKENGQEDLDGMARRFSAHPEVVSVLKSHGFTPHEFALCQMVVFQAAFAEAAKQAGADPAKLASDAHVNPANLTFVEQHKAELDAMKAKTEPPKGNDSDN
ncbi:MAG TPA: hypothetical protein VF126_17845 [Acidobacteriaceae bacterium]